jgi:hypothetical protein
MNSPLRLLFKSLLVCLITFACAALVQAKVTRIVIEQKQSPAYDGKSFGTTGQYEILTGKAYCELDPRDPHNTIITDIQFAPRNSRGMVEYVATFTLVKPVDPTKANGVLLYAVPNRGNRITVQAFGVSGGGGESGDEFFLKRGFMILHSGWQGDLAPRPNAETISVPIAKNPDGSSITGLALTRFSNMAAGTTTLPLPPAHEAASLDTTQATLTKRASEEGAIIPIAGSEWTFGDCSQTAFPGRADANKICLKGGFDPAYLYELRYIAKDPLVLGIGFAATRDINAFFRHAASGEGNPVANVIKHIIAQGISQSGNFIKTFIHLGFNQDEQNRIVWNGANAHIAGRQLAMNIRFAYPGGAANLYEAGSEATLWWGDYEDKTRGRKSASMLDRCRATKTCPKIFETFGSAEFWGLRMSPNLLGPNAEKDIELPANVRRYYFPGTTHGGGRGGFSAEVPAAQGLCALPANVNPQAEQMRALILALTDWVTKNTAPPASVYPRLDQGDLVRPDHAAMGFPLIPGAPLPNNLFNPLLDYDFGAEFKYADLSGVITIVPPVIKRTLPSLVPKVNADGNETSGIASPLLQAPLGTYLGWNVTRSGFYKDRVCGFAGGFIPFAKTRAERLATGDPRLSLEERYKDHAGYVAAVKKAVESLLAQRFLLTEDAAHLIQQAENSSVLR